MTPLTRYFAVGYLALWVLPGLSSTVLAQGFDGVDSRESGAEPKDWDQGQYWVIEFKPERLRMIAPSTAPELAATRLRLQESEGAPQEPSEKAAGSTEDARAERRQKDKEGGGRVYWYLVYTLENKTGEDRQLYVNVTAETDGKRQYADLFSPSVEKAIEKRERQPLWGKVDEFKTIADRDPSDPKYRYVTLEAGEKRRCVAIFSPIDPNVTKVKIRVTGLSNEVRRFVKDDGSVELQHRVRELEYTRPGDEYAVALDRFKFVDKGWVKERVPLKSAATAETE
jgi:hypothetical protein